MWDPQTNEVVTGMSRHALRQLLKAALVLGICASSGFTSADEVDDASDREWQYQTPRRPALPRVQGTDWLRTPVDAFILSELESAGLQPADQADRRVLLRRLCFDLLGLPPTLEQTRAFLGDRSPDAYERLVDRLLASPGYGERWAQHWLDVVRYADSDGFEYDDPRPHAWRYRDWVIAAFNSNKPFDRFVRDQIAADELSSDLSDLPALGLHRMGPLRKNAGVQDEQKNRQEVLTEIVDGFASAFLGLTFGCARCHDHKFDPIPQADYYRMQAFFAATDAADVAWLPRAERERRETALASWRQRRESVDKELEDILQPVRSRLLKAKRGQLDARTRSALDTDAATRTEQQNALVEQAQPLLVVTQDELLAGLEADSRRRAVVLQGQLTRLDADRPQTIPTVMAVRDRERDVPATFVLDRGDPHARLKQVPPQFPAILVGPGQPVRPVVRSVKSSQSSDGGASPGRRAALARWLTDSEHPLTARVFVNRVWYHHFGRGIVATPNDFGAMGAAVSHPRLLDWLAVEFSEGGWNVKRLHRQLLLSAAYRQSSRPRRPSAVLVDPDNQLLWKANRRRIEAEVLRDSLLFTAGGLNRSMGGPGVRLPLPPEIASLQYKGQWQPDTRPARFRQRSIYLFVKRNIQNPLLESFDAPGTLVPCGRRSRSAHAGQALMLLNSPVVSERAQMFAARLAAEVGTDPAVVVPRAYRLAVGREPKSEELRLATAFLQRGAGTPMERLGDFCLAMFNLDEFLYID